MKKRAGSLVELLMMMVVTIFTASIVVSFAKASNQVWMKSTSEHGVKDTLYQAANKIAPYLRNGLKVDLSSNSTQLTIIQPQIDTVNGGYILPLTTGDSYSFYLSDSSGTQGANGTILWMAKNGVPDPNWSLRSGAAAVDLGTSSLTFSYAPIGDPETVTLAMNATKNAGRGVSADGTVTTSLILRNHMVARGGQ